MAKTDKQKEYEAVMERQNGSRSVIAGFADPFSEYAMTDFVHECEILERLGEAWKMSFCQATMGFSRRPGGLWLAYTPDRKPKSVLHVERFLGKSGDHDEINFWASDILQGKLYSGAFKLPFVLIASFEDGVFSCNFADDPIARDLIGERVRKGKAYEGCVNMVTYMSLRGFRQLGKKSRESKDK